MTNKLYVVYHIDRYQDCTEDHAKVVHNLEAALELADKWGEEVPSCITEVMIFELGKEIPIEKVKTEVPQPPVVISKYKLKEEKK